MSPQQSHKIATHEYTLPRVTPVDAQKLRVEVQRNSFGHSTADRHRGISEDRSAQAEVIDLHDVRHSLNQKRAAKIAHAATGGLVKVARSR